MIVCPGRRAGLPEWTGAPRCVHGTTRASLDRAEVYGDPNEEPFVPQVTGNQARRREAGKAGGCVIVSVDIS